MLSVFLLEDGSELLLEDGTQLLLEESSEVVVEPPSDAIVGVLGLPRVARRPPEPQIVHGSFRISGGGHVEVTGHKEREGSSNEEVFAILSMAA